MQTEEKNWDKKRQKRKMKLSKKVLSFIWIRNRSRECLFYLLSKLFTLLGVIPSVLLAASFQIALQLSQVYSHTNLKTTCMYEFFKNHPRRGVFRNVNLSNLENVLQRNLRTERAGSAFLEHLEAQIWKVFLLSANLGGSFVSSIYVSLCPKKLWIRQWPCKLLITIVSRYSRAHNRAQVL